MSETKLTFDYYYGNQAEQFAFYRIPKQLFTNPAFSKLSSDAKVLYGLMLDRMSLSIKSVGKIPMKRSTSILHCPKFRNL